jgi:hypothetical protein
MPDSASVLPPEDRQRLRDRCIDQVKALAAGDVHPKTAEFLTYYARQTPPDRLAARQQIDPLDIPQLLPGVWLVDVLRPQPGSLRFRYRLLGSRVAQIFKSDANKKYLDEVHADFGTNPMRGFLEEVATHAVPHWRRGKPLAWPSQDVVLLERIYLPLATDGATVDMIFALTLFTLPDGREV